MKRVKRYCEPGAWVSIPLWEGTHSLGKVVAVDKYGFLCGYFFMRLLFGTAHLSDTAGLSVDDAAFAYRVDPGGFRNDGWQVIDTPAPFDSDAWPIPVFTHEEFLTNRIRYSEYSGQDLITPKRIWFLKAGSAHIDERFDDGLATPGIIYQRMKYHMRNEYYERRPAPDST